MKVIFLGLLGALVIYVTYVLVHTGAFKPVELELVDGPKFQIVYKDHVGPYHQISATIAEVEKWLAGFNIGCRQSFGMFLDDPQTVEEERLRSRVGCLAPGPMKDPASGIHYQEIPERKYLKASFGGSPAIGPYKVYTKAIQMIEQDRLQIDGPIMEVYSLHSGGEMKTEYYFPVTGGAAATADGSN